MTEQEKAALLTFMGVTHAQAKQSDQAIVGNADGLKPLSNQLQAAFSQALHAPTDNYQHRPVYAPVAEPVVPLDQQLEFNYSQPVSVAADAASQVLTTQIIDILTDINLNLIRVANILEQKDDRPKRTKNTKPT